MTNPDKSDNDLVHSLGDEDKKIEDIRRHNVT